MFRFSETTASSLIFGGETGQMVFLQAISARWRCPRPKEWVELHQCKSTVWRGWTQCRLLPTPKTSSESQKKTVDDVFFENPGFHACWRLETISCSLHVSQCRMSINNYPVDLATIFDGRNPVCISFLTGFYTSQWCRVSSINNISWNLCQERAACFLRSTIVFF